MPLFNPPDSPVDDPDRFFRSRLSENPANLLSVSGTAYCVYIGQLVQPITVAKVLFQVTGAGAGTQTAVHVMLLSTPTAPLRVTQTLTVLAFAALTSGANELMNATGYKYPTAAMNALIPAGTQLWAGLRTAMTTTQISTTALFGDMGQGALLMQAAAAIPTVGATYTTATIPAASVSMVPEICISLD